jgi:outer membrane lipoprotein-sorting protein
MRRHEQSRRPEAPAGRRWRLALGLGIALLAAHGRAAAEADAKRETPTLEALMAGMASSPGVEARFVERKEVALLSEPIETRGTLIFVPPDRLVRTTSTPSRSRLVIAGERVAFEDTAGGNALDLGASPLAREFVDNFIVLFAGDLARLRERYVPVLDTGPEAWTLTLTPRHRPLADFVERIVLRGAGRTLLGMEMLERDGDRTATRFEDVSTERRFTPAELERLFAIPAAGAGG